MFRTFFITLVCLFSSPAYLSANSLLSKDEKLSICKTAFKRGQANAVKNKNIPNVSSTTKKKSNIRDYEIKDKYIEEARKKIFWKDVALKAYTLASYGAMSAIAVVIPQTPAIFSSLFTPVHPLAMVPYAGPAQGGIAGNMLAGLKMLYTFATTSYLFTTVFAEDLRAGVNWFKSTGIWAMNQPMVWMGLVKQSPELLNPEVEIEAFQLKFDELKDTLPTPYKDRIEGILDRLKTTFSPDLKKVQMAGEPVIGDKTVLKKDLKRIEMIYKLPRELKPIHRKDYQKKLDELLINYDDDLQTKIRELVAGIEASSKPTTKFDPFERTGNAPTRRVIYLLGPPGTGKTYLGEKLADVLDLPFIQLSALELKELAEVQRKARGEDTPALRITQKIAHLPENKRFKNIVVFVDEFDKIMQVGKSSGGMTIESSSMSSGDLQSFFLEFFDSKKSLFNLGNLDVNPVSDVDTEIDMSSMIFILAGNKPLTDSSNAMVKRIRTTEFNTIGEDKRLEIACQGFGEQTSEIELNEEEKRHIKSEIPRIVALIEKDFDLNLGIKPLIKTIEDFTDHLSMKFHGSSETIDLEKRLELHSKETWDPQTAMTHLRRLFEKRKHTLYSGVVSETMKRIDTIERRFYSNLYDAKTMENLFNNLERTMNLPGPSKSLIEDQVAIEKKLDELLNENYPQEMAERIRTIVQRHIEASADPESASRNLVYFFGEPGLGKSTVARRIAEAMNLPVIELRLDGSADKLIGKSHGVLFPYAYEDAKFELSQLTSQLLCEKGAPQIPSNAVLLINDAANNDAKDAAALRSFLLNDLFEPTRKELKLNDLLLPIDISKFLIIMTANRLILEDDKKTSSQRSAINDRLDLLEFQALTEKGVHKAAGEIFTKQVAGHEFDAELLEKIVSEYYKLGIGSLRPLENPLLLDYSNCIKSAKRTGKKCEYDYMRRLKQIEQKEAAIAKHM